MNKQETFVIYIDIKEGFIQKGKKKKKRKKRKKFRIGNIRGSRVYEKRFK